MITLELPLPYYKSNSKALMSVNVYRNLFHYALSKFKKEYGSIIAQVISEHSEQEFSSLRASYVLHTKSTKAGKPKKYDLVNILSMVDKVFMDELVKAKWIKDDCVEFVDDVRFKANPYSERDYIEVVLEEKQ